MNKIKPEACIYMEEGAGGENRMKEGEGISQRIYMHNPRTQTTVW